MRKKRVIAAVIIAAALLVAVTVLYILTSLPPKAADDEIMLKIQLDLKEDIGLLIFDHYLDGKKGGGGISNADRSMLRSDSVLYWSFSKQDYPDLADTVAISMLFTVVTEYCDPNFDNIYPEELLRPMETVSFRGDLGKMYLITITGDSVSGYSASFEGQA